jgi:hypothetical protein
LIVFLSFSLRAAAECLGLDVDLSRRLDSQALILDRRFCFCMSVAYYDTPCTTFQDIFPMKRVTPYHWLLLYYIVESQRRATSM